MWRVMLLCLLALPVWGKDVNVSWTAPVGNCDGTPLADLTGYKVRWGTGSATLPATDTQFTIPALTPGPWWVHVAAFNSQGAESQYVGAWKEVGPEEFVTTSNKVYTFFRANGNIVVTVTPHTVKLGVVCDATQQVNGKYRIPLENVTWAGVRLSAALADCG